MAEAHRVTCESCGREIACDPDTEEEEVRCACGQMVGGDPGEGSQEDLSAEDVAGKWFYEADNQRYGPVPLNTLRQFVAEGKLGPDNLLWRRGMDEWTPVSDAPLVAEALASPAPDEAPTEVYEIPEPVQRPVPNRTNAEPSEPQEATDALIRALSGLCYLTGGAFVVGVPVLLYLGIEGRFTPLQTVVGTLVVAFGGMMFLGAGQLIMLLCRMAERLRRIEAEMENRLPEGRRRP